MKGNQTKVTRDKRKSFSKPVYVLVPPLFFYHPLPLYPLGDSAGLPDPAVPK